MEHKRNGIEEAIKEIDRSYEVLCHSCHMDERRKNAFLLAKDLMKKEIPEVPEYTGDGYYNGQIVIDTWVCPNCGKGYEIDYENYKYCPECGQHIDHSTLTEDD